ncbi:hypothetical protein TNCV_4418861 [Trichonephila clavipes]|nr:hypothetical protein TNCV_4418861 [Trichonephila clavipes]
MDEDRTTKKCFYVPPIGTRRKVSPNLRSIDGLEKELLVLRSKNWKTLAGRRLAWRRPRTTLGCTVTKGRITPEEIARNKKLLGIPANRILRLLNEDKMAASTSRVCSSSMFLMKWNGIMESFLIDEVEKLPYLWNPRHPHFTKRLKKIGFQQIAMRMSERWPALEAFFTPEVCIAKFKNLRTYYRNEKQKLSSFRVEQTSLNVSDEDLFENDVELPPIPNRAPSESELPQRVRVFTSTPVTTSTPPVTTSTPPLTTSTPRAKKKKS